jgi:hypothetical protein
MQVRNNWLSNELYKLGLQQSRLLYPEASEDLLHDVLEKFQLKINLGKLHPSNINKNLLFISIRNAATNIHTQQQSRRKKVDSITEELRFQA